MAGKSRSAVNKVKCLKDGMLYVSKEQPLPTLPFEDPMLVEFEKSNPEQYSQLASDVINERNKDKAAEVKELNGYKEQLKRKDLDETAISQLEQKIQRLECKFRMAQLLNACH